MLSLRAKTQVHMLLLFTTECLTLRKSGKVRCSWSNSNWQLYLGSSSCSVLYACVRVGSRMIWQIGTRSNDTGRGRTAEKRPIAKRLVRACDKNCVDSSTPRSATISWACSLRLSQQDPSWSLVGLGPLISKWSQTMKHLGLSHKLTKNQESNLASTAISVCMKNI